MKIMFCLFFAIFSKTEQKREHISRIFSYFINPHAPEVLIFKFGTPIFSKDLHSTKKFHPLTTSSASRVLNPIEISVDVINRCRSFLRS